MFAKRLFLYLIGFLLGSVIVYFLFFKDKDRSFLPSSIILDNIKSKEIVFDTKAECILLCHGLSNKNLKTFLSDGDVIFSESSPRETPKKYVVEIETPVADELKITVELSDKMARIISVNSPAVKTRCSCE